MKQTAIAAAAGAFFGAVIVALVIIAILTLK